MHLLHDSRLADSDNIWTVVVVTRKFADHASPRPHCGTWKQRSNVTVSCQRCPFLTQSRSPPPPAKRSTVMSLTSVPLRCDFVACRPQPSMLHVIALHVRILRPTLVQCTGAGPAGARGRCSTTAAFDTGMTYECWQRSNTRHAWAHARLTR